MTPQLSATRDRVADHMDEILRLFIPGGKITVLVRFEGFPDRDFMMTNEENVPDAIVALERRHKEMQS